MTTEYEAVLLGISIPNGLSDLMEMGKAKRCKLEIYKDGILEIRVKGQPYSSPIMLRFLVKDILEILKIDLPSWAIKEKIVKEEKVVEKTVEILPKLGKCSQCDKPLSEVSEVILFTRDRKVLFSFCSDVCRKKWIDVFEGEKK